MNAIVVPSPSTAASTWPTWSPTSALALTVIPASPSPPTWSLTMFAGLVGDERRRPDGAQQLLAIEDGPRRVRLRQDLLVVRELAVDEPADEVDALEVEQDLVAAAGEDDLDRVVGVGQDPRQLVERPGRDDDARLRDGIEDRDGLDRDPVVVGRGERQRDRPRTGRGRRSGSGAPRRWRPRRSSRRGPAQDVLGDPRRRSLAGGLDRRELVRVDALDVRLEAAAAEVERVAGPGARGRPRRRPAAS